MACIRVPWVLCGNSKLMYCQDLSNKARGENGIKYSNRLDGKIENKESINQSYQNFGIYKEKVWRPNILNHENLRSFYLFIYF